MDLLNSDSSSSINSIKKKGEHALSDVHIGDTNDDIDSTLLDDRAKKERKFKRIQTMMQKYVVTNYNK